ncbi:MAG: lamin tail domain-containing protein, partial [bacterium]
MFKRGGLKIIIISAIIGAGFFCWKEVEADQNAQNILISEIQIGGATAYDEFVELYNPTDRDINLEGWKMQTKSANSGTWINRTGSSGLPTVVIYSGGYSLLAAKDYSLSIVPDFRHLFNWGLADGGGHVRIIDNSNIEIDKVGYGDVNDPEGAATPATGKNLARNIVNGIMQDTNNNNADFEIKDTPNPQNSNSAIVAPLPIEEPENSATSTPTADRPAVAAPPTDAETATST